MKKLLLFLLLAALLCGCATASPQEPDPGMTLPIFPDREDYHSDYEEGIVVGGKVNTSLTGAADGKVSFGKCWRSEDGKDYTDPATYTLNEFISGNAAPWLLFDSKYNDEYASAIWFDRVALEVKSLLDDGTDANVWHGYARFNAGFNDWRGFAVGGVAGGSTLIG